MASPSDERFLVLHRLRVKGLAEVADDQAGVTATLAAAGLVERRDGVVSGWRLTAAGREAHARLLADDLAPVDRDRLEAGYRRFLASNQAFLQVCTDWQLDGVDGIARLEAIHGDVVPVVDGLVDVLERFAAYRHRLDAALARVRAGEGAYVTSPMVDSYHTVWSELHEDLLATLGIARGSELVAETEVA